jgi:FMN reductase (NADPH)
MSPRSDDGRPQGAPPDGPEGPEPAPGAVLRRQTAHRSVRRFRPEAPSEAHVRAAFRAAQCAATSHLVQSYAAIRVRVPERRARLAELCGNQPWVADSGAFFVLCGDQRRHRRILEGQGRTYAANLETFLLAAIDTALFAQNLALAFEDLGYGICFIGGLRNRSQEVDDLLELPHGLLPFFGLCVGVPDESPRRLPRLPLEGVLFEERYGPDEAVDAAVEQLDRELEAWHSARGKAGRTWSGSMLRLFTGAQRAHLAAYYHAKGARFD